MIKWFVYIVLLLIFAPCLSSANKIKSSSHNNFIFLEYKFHEAAFNEMSKDSLTKKAKQQQEDEKNKVKEIAKAKRQAKPEKIDEAGNEPDSKVKTKPKRQRRPEGLEQPPEIPRRNAN
jgi:hypothetical protein